jgi:hypothetical protein
VKRDSVKMVTMLKGLVDLSAFLALDFISSMGNIAENGESMARTLEREEVRTHHT